MRLLVLVILICTSKSHGFSIICDLKHSDVGYGHYDTCEVIKVFDTSSDKIIETAIGWSKSRTVDDVRQFYSEYVNCVNFPFDLNKVFPELEVIRLLKSNVKYIEPMDLKNLAKLKIFDLEENNIEVLQSDMFLYNQKLKEIHLRKNKLKFIASRVFNHGNLIVLDLSENICINGKAVNDISALLTLKQKVEEVCSAPEFLLAKNVQLIKNLVDLNFTFVNVSQRREFLESENFRLNSTLLTCEDEKQSVESEKFSLNIKLRRDSSVLRKCSDELKTIRETNNGLITENVRLTNEIKKTNQKINDAESKIYSLITNSKVCEEGQADSFKERTLKYENEKLMKEISELKNFKLETEREWRSINFECQFVDWNKEYTCQSEKLIVKVDDTDVIIVGKHVKGKSNYDVKKIFLNSKDSKTIYFPINFGTIFPQVQSIIVQNSNLISIKIESFDNMKTLKELMLDNNSIEEVPQDTFTYLENLEKLSLSFNQIKALYKDTFVLNKRLKYLILNDNKIQKIHAELFKHNENLEIINLQNNNIKHIGIRAFEYLKKLSSVNLDNNQCISGKFNHTSLKAVTDSILVKCSAPESQEIVCKFEQTESNYACNLVDLRVDSDNVIISNIDGNHLGSKSNDNVKELKATDQQIMYFPSGFSNYFKNVEKIVVKNSQTHAIGENDFKGLLILKELVLSSNKISFIHEKSMNDLTSLETFDLSNNQIVEIFENTFSKLTKLRVINISTNKIQKLPNNLLSKNKNLEIFDASGNKIVYIGAILLNNKSVLKEVNFVGNECIDENFSGLTLNTLKLKIIESCQ